MHSYLEKTDTMQQDVAECNIGSIINKQRKKLGVGHKKNTKLNVEGHLGPPNTPRTPRNAGIFCVWGLETTMTP